MTRDGRSTDATDGLRIAGLDSLLAAMRDRRLPPVETWSPATCGDIGLAIRADGTWTQDGRPFTRERLVRLFSTILIREGDGRYYLVTPVEKVVVHVEDAPFLAVEMDVRGAGREQTITLRTGLDDIVTCGPGHRLRFASSDETGAFKPYVHVRRGLDALLSRSLAYDLAGQLAPRDPATPDDVGIWSGGEWFPLAAD